MPFPDSKGCPHSLAHDPLSNSKPEEIPSLQPQLLFSHLSVSASIITSPFSPPASVVNIAFSDSDPLSSFIKTHVGPALIIFPSHVKVTYSQIPEDWDVFIFGGGALFSHNI